MIYTITKFVFKNAFRLYFKKVTVCGGYDLPRNKPVILALNHPNSLLDALIVAVNIREPINSLTRGDAFKKPWVGKILRTYHMIPVYRISEGKENIGKNFAAFEAGQKNLEVNRTVLIFAEGLCEHNWKLRPLKKGVARLAQYAWMQPSTANTVVVPVGLTYQHFKGAGKSLIINFGKYITKEQFEGELNSAGFVNLFNNQLFNQLDEVIYRNENLEADTTAHRQFISYWNQLEKKYRGIDLLHHLKKGFEANAVTISKNIIPSAFHATVVLIPHYLFCKWLTIKLTKGTVFHDSVLFGLLVFLFPVYVLFVVLVVYFSS